MRSSMDRNVSAGAHSSPTRAWSPSFWRSTQDWYSREMRFWPWPADVGQGQKRAVEVAPTAAGCGVRFSDGTSIEADVVVLAINGWLTDVLPTIPLVVTEQLMHYLVPNPGEPLSSRPGACRSAVG